MLAAVSDKYGSPDIIRVMDVDRPVPGGHEILVKVFASTVNRTDCAILRGKPLIFRLFTGIISLTNEFYSTLTGQKVKLAHYKNSLKGN